MDMAPQDTIEQQRRRIASVVEHYELPATVSGYDIRIEDTWDGEPAAWIMLHTPARGTYSKQDSRAFRDLMTGLQASVRTVVPGREVYVHFIAEPGA